MTSTAFFSSEEIDRGAASLLQELATGEGVLLVDGWSMPHRVMTPLAEDPYSHAVKFGDKKVAAWIQQIADRPEFVSPSLILAEHRKFQSILLEELYAMNVPRIEAGQDHFGSDYNPRKLKLP